MEKIAYFGNAVRINPLWIGEDGEFLRDQAGEPVAWSVETGHRDPETGHTLWTVAADFADRTTAGLVAMGDAFLTVVPGPGGGLSYVCCEIVDEGTRAFADHVEWGGDYGDYATEEEAGAAMAALLGRTVHADWAYTIEHPDDDEVELTLRGG